MNKEEMKEHSVYAIKFASQQMLIDKLQNNWKELKKWVKEYEENSYGLGSYETGIADGLGDVLKKIQELEGNNE